MSVTWEKELDLMLEEYENKYGTDDGMPWIDIGVYGTYKMLKAANGRRVIADYEGEALMRIVFESETGEREIYFDWGTDHPDDEYPEI